VSPSNEAQQKHQMQAEIGMCDICVCGVVQILCCCHHLQYALDNILVTVYGQRLLLSVLVLVRCTTLPLFFDHIPFEDLSFFQVQLNQYTKINNHGTRMRSRQYQR